MDSIYDRPSRSWMSALTELTYLPFGHIVLQARYNRDSSAPVRCDGTDRSTTDFIVATKSQLVVMTWLLQRLKNIKLNYVDEYDPDKQFAAMTYRLSLIRIWSVFRGTTKAHETNQDLQSLSRYLRP